MSMSIEFENKLTYNRISFQRSNRLHIDEREIHSYHEILFCMDANITLFTEKHKTTIQGDTLLLIPKETYHYFLIQDCSSFSRLKIYIPADVLEGIPCSDMMTDLRIIEKPSGTIRDLLYKLCRITGELPSDKHGFYAYSVLLMLLTELDRSGSISRTEQQQTKVGTMGPIVSYISEHLSEDLTVETLSKQMGISPSGFTHIFKHEIGISVHQYITQRRMIFAQALLQAGKKPTKIYLECGYGDYSSFYKAYISFWGYPPSAEENKHLALF